MELKYETEKVKNIEVVRAKKVYELSFDEFLDGKWLNDIRKAFNYDKLDLAYKNNILIVYFYKQTEEVRKNE